jgi:hypothetical protein
MRIGIGLSSLLVVSGCRTASSRAPEPAVVVAPAVRASSHPARLAPEPKSARELVDSFAFHHGAPMDELGDYAKSYWGPNGIVVFQSSASVRPGEVVDAPGVERLMEIGRYAVIEVPGRGGFYVRDFGERGWVIELSARDVRGSGESDVILSYRTSDEGADLGGSEPPQVTRVTHFVLEVWSFRTPEPTRSFAHEIGAWANCCGSEVTKAPPRVQNSVHMEPGKIVLEAGKAWRANASTFHPRALPGIPALLVPWGEVTSRTFHYDGRQFVP